MEDASEAESRGKSSAPTSPLILDESKTAKIPEFPLTLLQTQPKCEVYPDLHKIIQVLSEVSTESSKMIDVLLVISYFQSGPCYSL